MKRLIPLAVLAMLSACNEKDEPVPAPAMVHKQVETSFEYTSHFNLDVNNDAKDDFMFNNVLVHDSRGSHNLFLINPLQQNELLLNTEVEHTIGSWISPLASGTEVREDPKRQSQWSRENSYVLDLRSTNEIETYYEGPLSEEGGEVYVGIKLAGGEKVNYGWLRLTYVMGSTKVEVREVAYNPVQGGLIKAGQK